MSWATKKQRQKCFNCSSGSDNNNRSSSSSNSNNNSSNCAPSNKINSSSDFL
ncbi:uncharacterized protein LOC123038142 [Drosophila rhopaloa]|uniref:Uncharacterized protein n=1 Tax=Drosophila rhopaloa TaxID=1041015 RepID=A0ABM5JG91_DRORH|nr:uncharacterized protein LOC123038142 [Drosophila rhopaloa]